MVRSGDGGGKGSRPGARSPFTSAKRLETTEVAMSYGRTTRGWTSGVRPWSRRRKYLRILCLQLCLPSHESQTTRTTKRPNSPCHDMNIWPCPPKPNSDRHATLPPFAHSQDCHSTWLTAPPRLLTQRMMAFRSAQHASRRGRLTTSRGGRCSFHKDTRNTPSRNRNRDTGSTTPDGRYCSRPRGTTPRTCSVWGPPLDQRLKSHAPPFDDLRGLLRCFNSGGRARGGGG